MQVQRARTPPTTGMKRARMQSFPSAFEEQLLRLFAARSAFLRDQLECWGDDATSVSLQLPEGIGALWLECILTLPPDLQKVDDGTLASYLKASEFFQDFYMVNKLCTMLGNRLFKSHPEGAGASSSDQQPATMQHIAQVLGQLSSDLVMEVLRSAPGSLQEQLPHLSPPLASLAALVYIPSLAAVCSPAPEGADQGASEEHTALTLCVCTSSAQPVAAASRTQDAIDCIAGASMWVHKDQVTSRSFGNMDRGPFTLGSRPGVVTCRLLARVSSLQGTTICLPDRTCLLLGQRALKLDGVTFKGGAVVCSGASSEATFEDSVFDRCSLVVLSAAQATLSRVSFQNLDQAQSGLGIMVHGVSSRVCVRGGTVAGSSQGVAVQAGGHLEANGLTITVDYVGAEVQGQGSCLSITESNLVHGSSASKGRRAALGVLAHSQSSAHLSRLDFRGLLDIGVHVTSRAAATLDECQVSECRTSCRVLDSTCQLTRCTLSGAMRGLDVSGEGSIALATECRILHSKMHGAEASEGATLTAVSCTSSNNGCFSFNARGVGSVLDLTECASEKDGYGCSVFLGSMLRATRVAVTHSRNEGFMVHQGAHAVLKECSAKACGEDAGEYAREEGHGVLCCGRGSTAHVEGCTFERNRRCGVLVEQGAEVTVEGCHSSQHSSAAGYCAAESALLKVSGSTSEGDKQGCSAVKGGQLTMEDVTVNGILQSGQLPRRSRRGTG